MMTRKKLPTEVVLNVESLNARLLAGYCLTALYDGDRITRCTVEFLDDVVPVALFNTYLEHGLIEKSRKGEGFTLSTQGRKRIR